MVAKPRRHLQEIPQCPHGSLSLREMAESALSPGSVVDFSASCNPLGTAPGVAAALAELELARYPDDRSLELRRALARTLGLGVEWVVAGNGSVDLMWQLASAYLEPGDPVLISGPTFGEYARACCIAGARVEEVRAAEETGFRPNVEAIVRSVRASRPKLAFVCNPNNPTGQLLGEAELLEILESCENTLLVVDEAYLSFCDSPPNLLPYLEDGRLLLLRSMTKDHGLAGLRLGYAAAHPDVTGCLDRVRPPWSVSVAAQAAGLAVLGETAHVENGRRVVSEARPFLAEQLAKLGLQVIPSTANFLLVRVGHGASLRLALMERGICVRDCASFGLPAYVRIGVRTLPECRMLVEAAREVAGGD